MAKDKELDDIMGKMLDSMKEFAPRYAKFTKEYINALQEEGFTKKEAIQIAGGCRK